MSFRERAPQWAWLAAHIAGWRPDEFWKSTPAELLSVLQIPGDEPGSAPPSRDLIAQLMERDSHG